MTMWRPPTALALLVLASAGAILTPRRTADRLLLATTVAGGAIVVAFMYPGGVAMGTGLPPGYWGDVVMPVILACAPVGLALATGTARREAAR